MEMFTKNKTSSRLKKQKVNRLQKKKNLIKF